MTTKGTDNRFRSLTVVGESGTPSTPGTGDFKLYVADDGTFYLMDDTGTPTAIGGGGFSDPMTTRGDIIVRNASNVTARLGIGSAGKVLSSDGTDISWQTPSSGGALVLLEQHTASSSATLDFSTFISSTYDDYEFRFIDILPATDGAKLRMRVGTGGGPTYDTGNNYSWVSYVSTQSTAGQNGAGSVAFIGIGAEEGTSTTASSIYGLEGRMAFSNPNSALAKKVSAVWNQVRSSGPSLLLGTVVGTYNPTTAVTAARFYFDTGNIASGTIRVYGVAK